MLEYRYGEFMEQSWTKEDIKKRIKQADANTDYESLSILKSILNDLKEKEKRESMKVEKKYFFFALSTFKLDYFSSSFFKMIDYISDRLKKLDLNVRKYEPYFDKFDIVQDMCKSFFKRGDKSGFTFFKKIMLNHSSRFKLYREDSLTFSGRTYYLGEDDFYVLINGNGSLHEMTIAVHEIKHIENMYKGYNKGVMLYEELPSLLYQLYALDFLIESVPDYDNAYELLRRHFIKYIRMILDIKEKSDIIRKLLIDDKFYSNIYENYDLYYDELKLSEVFSFLRFGVSDKQIGYIVSFLASIDIYLNSKKRNSENAVTGYLFGLYKIKPHLVDYLIDYIENILGKNEDCDKKQYKILI